MQRQQRHPRSAGVKYQPAVRGSQSSHWSLTVTWYTCDVTSSEPPDLSPQNKTRLNFKTQSGTQVSDCWDASPNQTVNTPIGQMSVTWLVTSHVELASGQMRSRHVTSSPDIFWSNEFHVPWLATGVTWRLLLQENKRLSRKGPLQSTRGPCHRPVEAVNV